MKRLILAISVVSDRAILCMLNASLIGLALSVKRAALGTK